MGGNKFWSVVQSIFSAARREITDFLGDTEVMQLQYSQISMGLM